MKCNIYYTTQDRIDKTSCILIEKSYLSNLKLLVLCATQEQQETINKLLWTYGKTQFIPHGSKLDPIPEMQPIYINNFTNNFENPSNASSLMLINISDKIKNSQQVLSQYLNCQFERLFCICTLDNESYIQKEFSLLLKNYGYEIQSFTQQQDNTWKAS